MITKGRTLALDVGQRRTGLAVSDSDGLLATPYTTITAKTPQKDIAAILAALNARGRTGKGQKEREPAKGNGVEQHGQSGHGAHPGGPTHESSNQGHPARQDTG